MSCKREVKHHGGLEERGFENKGQNEGFKEWMLDRQGSDAQNWDVSGERDKEVPSHKEVWLVLDCLLLYVEGECVYTAHCLNAVTRSPVCNRVILMCQRTE